MTMLINLYYRIKYKITGVLYHKGKTK